MKVFLAVIFLSASLPINAYENIRNRNILEGYESKKGYAFENKCFRYEYREHYIPGNSTSPGYVKSYNEKISIPCASNRNAINHYYNNHSQSSYIKYKNVPQCSASTTFGGLIGGTIAASLSTRDAYGWSIPLGAVLGAGIGNAKCK